MSVDHIAMWLGYWLAFILAAGALLGALYLILGELGREVFLRLQRVYALHVIGYWLDKLEREGWRVFPKARSFDATEQDPPADGVRR